MYGPYQQTSFKSLEEEKNIHLDRPGKGKTQEQLKRHSMDTASFENKPIERAVHILTMGDDVQKISIIQSLPQLIALDSVNTNNRIITKIKQDLPNASCEIHFATCAMFKTLFLKNANALLLQTMIQCIEVKDSTVSTAWTDALLECVATMPENMIQNTILPLAQQKAQHSAPLASKLFSCKLLGEVCGNTKLRTVDPKTELLPLVTALCQDPVPDVRAQMCAFLPNVTVILGANLEKSNLMSCVVELAQDENVNVRSNSMIVLAPMLTMVSAATSKNTLLPLVKKLCTKAVDESIITAMVVSNELRTLMLSCSSLISNDDALFFMKIYKDLSQRGKQGASKANQASEVAVRQRCAANAFGIMKLVHTKLPAQLLEVYSTFREHAVDPCYIVRRAAAGSLEEIAKLLGKENKMMKNEIVRLIRDDAVEVLDVIVPSVSSIFQSLAESNTMSNETPTQITTELGKAMLKCLSELAKGCNWRLTVEFLKQFECLPQCMPGDYIHSTFTPALFDKINKANAKPVKFQAIRTIIVFLRYNFKPNQCKWLRESLIKQTVQSKSCNHRVLYFSVCESVLAVLSEKYFKEHFLAYCLELAKDRIIDIRWKFMQFSSKLRSMVTLAADVKTKQQIQDTITALENAEKAKCVLEIIKVKKREGPPKYAANALKEEEERVRNEATTQIVTIQVQAPAKVAPAAAPAAPGPKGDAKHVMISSQSSMHFLEQHFYIDAGINLETLDHQRDVTEKHFLTNITDDAKVNLRNLNKHVSRRHSSVNMHQIDANLGHSNENKRLSLNLSQTNSKIPIPNRLRTLSGCKLRANDDCAIKRRNQK